MKALTFALLSCTILLAAKLFSQDNLNRMQQRVLVSSRVSDVIDSMDLRYFGLFPSIADANSCTFVQRNDDSINIVITRGTGDTLVVLQRNLIKLLEQYIEQYEVLDETTFSKSLGEISRYIRPTSFMMRGQRVDLIVLDTTMQAEVLLGVEILLKTDTTLVVQTGNEPYRWNNVDSRVRIIHYADVNAIYPHHFKFNGVGAIIPYSLLTVGGGYFSRSKRISTSTLNTYSGMCAFAMIIIALASDFSRGDPPIPINSRMDRFHRYVTLPIEHTFFTGIVSPEIRKLLLQKVSRHTIRTREEMQDDNFYEWKVSSTTPLQIRGSYVKSMSIKTYTAGTIDRSVHYENHSDQLLRLELTRKLSDRFSLGAGLSSWISTSTDVSPSQAFTNLFVTIPHLNIEYLLWKSARDFEKYFEWSIAVSLGAGIVSREGGSFHIVNAYDHIDTALAVPALTIATPMLSLGTNLDFFFVRNCAIFVHCAAEYLTPVSFPGVQGIVDRFGRRYGLVADNIELNSIVPLLDFGLRWQV